MRQATKMELDMIAKIKNYKQPSCPGCGADMTLVWGSSVLHDNNFIAWYRCANPDCVGHWQTGNHTSINAAHAVEDAYKGAMIRNDERNKRSNRQAVEGSDLRS